MGINSETKKPAITVMKLMELLEELPRNTQIVQSKTGNLTFWQDGTPKGVIMLRQESLVYFSDKDE